MDNNNAYNLLNLLNAEVRSLLVDLAFAEALVVVEAEFGNVEGAGAHFDLVSDELAALHSMTDLDRMQWHTVCDAAWYVAQNA